MTTSLVDTRSAFMEVVSRPSTWAILLLSFLIVLAAEPALAQATGGGAVNLSPVTKILQGIITTLTGPLGRAIATIAVIGIGLSWFFGYMDFQRAFMIIVAIAIVAGAATIVSTVWGTGK